MKDFEKEIRKIPINDREKQIIDLVMEAFNRYLKNKPDFCKGYNILMDWFDYIPEEDREEVSKKLEKVGC